MESDIINMGLNKKTKRRETKQEVLTYLDRLKYALSDNTVKVVFQSRRLVDRQRNLKYTNRFTISSLFPDEDEMDVLKKRIIIIDCKRIYRNG